MSLSVQAQKKKSNSTIIESAKPIPDTVFKNLQWRNIGPTRGGRANAITGVINNSKKFYTGYTGGGVWETKDGGIKWKNISDGFFQVEVARRETAGVLAQLLAVQPNGGAELCLVDFE